MDSRVDLPEKAYLRAIVEACFNAAMLKTEAIELLGGTPSAAAAAIGVKPQAVSGWPDVLPARIADRVQAALYRRELEKQRQAKRRRAEKAC